MSGDLQLRLEGSDQLMHQPAFYFSLTNAGGPCIVHGYPGVQLLDSTGEPVHTDAGHGGGYIANDPGPHDVTLAPDGKAWFAVSSVALCTGRDGDLAPLAAAVAVTLPGGGSATTTSAGVPYCRGTPVLVSALTGARTDIER